ncbi:hypothetical protein V1517DRAFT_361256 [Lipomyces orientalis]|uniref:Uncharacterized protein n=1 Tax=Lipomyces orientalis TaxID=1233043 RepID=A0ACC3TNT4_9ASCO
MNIANCQPFLSPPRKSLLSTPHSVTTSGSFTAQTLTSSPTSPSTAPRYSDCQQECAIPIRSLLNPDNEADGAWTRDDIKFLLRCKRNDINAEVKTIDQADGPQSWAQISILMGDKTPAACQRMYRNILFAAEKGLAERSWDTGSSVTTDVWNSTPSSSENPLQYANPALKFPHASTFHVTNIAQRTSLSQNVSPVDCACHACGNWGLHQTSFPVVNEELNGVKLAPITWLPSRRSAIAPTRDVGQDESNGSTSQRHTQQNLVIDKTSRLDTDLARMAPFTIEDPVRQEESLSDELEPDIQSGSSKAHEHVQKREQAHGDLGIQSTTSPLSSLSELDETPTCSDGELEQTPNYSDGVSLFISDDEGDEDNKSDIYGVVPIPSIPSDPLKEIVNESGIQRSKRAYSNRIYDERQSKLARRGAPAEQISEANAQTIVMLRDECRLAFSQIAEMLSNDNPDVKGGYSELQVRRAYNTEMRKTMPSRGPESGSDDDDENELEPPFQEWEEQLLLKLKKLQVKWTTVKKHFQSRSLEYLKERWSEIAPLTPKTREAQLLEYDDNEGDIDGDERTDGPHESAIFNSPETAE